MPKPIIKNMIKATPITFPLDESGEVEVLVRRDCLNAIDFQLPRSEKDRLGEVIIYHRGVKGFADFDYPLPTIAPLPLLAMRYPNLGLPEDGCTVNQLRDALVKQGLRFCLKG